MTTSAFKSPSRTTKKDPNSTHNRNHRRSKSVTPFSRTHLDIISEFDNTRDNPLFWVDGSQLDFEGASPKNGVLGGFKGSDDGDSRRGRSELRNSGGGCRDGRGGGGGRSSSRVSAAGRRRSLSSARDCGNYESGKEQESELLSNLRSKNKLGLNRDHSSTGDKNHLVRSASDLSGVLKGWKTWSSQHPAFGTIDDSAISQSDSQITNWDDESSTRAILEIEEKSIKPVSVRKAYCWDVDNEKTSGIVGTVHFEVKRGISDMQNIESVMLRADLDNIASSIFPHAAPELENSNAVELVNDFREEFARELEECEERARKLRAELALEEHRELELSKILNNVVPEPKTPQAQKPHLVRKASTERRKMSKCLEDEAMAYFDECVSISTFEDSDFSSLEDPPSHMGRFDNLGVESTSIPGDPSRASVACSFESQDSAMKIPPMHFYEDCRLLAAGCSTNSPRTNISNKSTTKRQFSFASKKSGSSPFEQYIRNYVKDREGKNSESHVRKVSWNTDDYDSKVPTEKFLLDKMVFKGRIDCGSMLLCGGAIGFPGAPFTSGLW